MKLKLLRKKIFNLFFNNKKVLFYSSFDEQNYKIQLSDNYKTSSNYFSVYEFIIDSIIDNKFECFYAKDFLRHDSKKKINICLRHDIDADPYTALKCANYLSKRKVPGSFYFLPTAAYYGVFNDRFFTRNIFVENIIKQMVISGVEIGIHLDFLNEIFSRNSLDSLDFNLNELAFLRSLGVKVHGFTSHNSYPQYNAENFELFKELLLFNRSVFNPLKYKLGLTSFCDNNLSYEGSFIKKKSSIKFNEINKLKNAKDKKSFFYNYFVKNPLFDYQFDYQIWIYGRNKWVIGGIHNKSNEEIFKFDIGTYEMLSTLKSFPLGTNVLFVLHPEYFSRNVSEI